MSWLDELHALLNYSTAEELEQKWAKYKEFECGPELESFISSSSELLYDQNIDYFMKHIYQTGKEVYNDCHDEFAYAA